MVNPKKKLLWVLKKYYELFEWSWILITWLLVRLSRYYYILNPVFYEKGAKNFVVAQNLQKLSLLSDGVRWDNFCKYRATKKF